MIAGKVYPFKEFLKDKFPSIKYLDLIFNGGEVKKVCPLSPPFVPRALAPRPRPTSAVKRARRAPSSTPAHRAAGDAAEQPIGTTR